MTRHLFKSDQLSTGVDVRCVFHYNVVAFATHTPCYGISHSLVNNPKLHIATTSNCAWFSDYIGACT